MPEEIGTVRPKALPPIAALNGRTQEVELLDRGGTGLESFFPATQAIEVTGLLPVMAGILVGVTRAPEMVQGFRAMVGQILIREIQE